MITQFEQYLLAEKRYSPHTVKAYKTDLLQFVDFLCYTADNFNPSEVTQLLVRGWVVHLVKSGVAPRSVNRKIATLSTFFRYLRRIGVMTLNPAACIIHPKTPKRLPAFLNIEAVERIPPGPISAVPGRARPSDLPYGRSPRLDQDSVEFAE